VLDAGAVVPRPVEKDDLSCRGQVRYVALKVPLCPFSLGRNAKRHHARVAWVQRLHEALDGAALAGGVAPLKEGDNLKTFLLHPPLQLDQLDVQPTQFALIVLLGHLGWRRTRRFRTAVIGILGSVDWDAHAGLGRLARLVLPGGHRFTSSSVQSGDAQWDPRA